MLAIAAGLALDACGQSGANRAPGGAPQVGVVVIRPQPTLMTVVLPGRTSPYTTSDIRPQVNGILQARLFTEGSVVKAGQALYQIDPAPYRAAYDSATANLAYAQANLTTTQLKAQRYGSLLKQDAIGAQDYDDAEAAYKQAVANVLEQKANVETARINLGYTRIVAPISGRIGRSSVTQGALVTADQTAAMATIQALDPIYVDINQSSAELLALKKSVSGGQVSQHDAGSARVTLQLDDGSAYPLYGTLQFTDVTVDPDTGAVVLRAVFPNPHNVLLPGMYVRANVVEGNIPNAILAPQQGVGRNEKGEPTALVVDNKGFARLRLLRAGQTVGDKWLVTSGLMPGDKLIVEGLQKVSPDMPVRAVPAGSSGGLKAPAGRS